VCLDTVLKWPQASSWRSNQGKLRQVNWWRTRKARIIASILGFLVIFGVLGFRLDLEVRRFEIQTELMPPGSQITLVQLSDFHSNSYGLRQHRVVDQVVAVNPDAVLLTGDILDRRLPITNGVELVEELTARWPVFFINGNHEFLSRRDVEFEQILTNNGVTVMRGDVVEFTANGATIQIGGLDDVDVNWARPSQDRYVVQLQRLGSQLDPNLFSVVLSHRPERVVDFKGLGPNLVLSGHAHGGQWAIPGILPNGLFAPGQGLLPAMTNGLFEVDGMQLLVSRGLSRHSPPVPRIFNRPDMIVITLRGL